MRVRIWRAADGEPVRTLGHIASIDGIRFSHSGSLLVSSHEDGTLRLWKALTEPTD